jgi:hypothetical protein
MGEDLDVRLDHLVIPAFWMQLHVDAGLLQKGVRKSARHSQATIKGRFSNTLQHGEVEIKRNDTECDLYWTNKGMDRKIAINVHMVLQ